MKAYKDTKCVYGYMTVCDNCLGKAPWHIDTTTPIEQPPALGKRQRCELCGKHYVLEGIVSRVLSEGKP